MEVDERWTRLLTKQIQVAEVNLVATLGEAPVTLGQILNMQVGDIISLEIPEAIVAEVDGLPVLECKYGVLNGQYALKVNKILTLAAARSSCRSAAMAEEGQVSDDDRAAAMSEQGGAAAASTEDDWAAAMAEQASAPTQPQPQPAAPSFEQFTPGGLAGKPNNLEMILDIPVNLTVELGRTKIAIRSLLQLAQGSVVELDGLAGEPMNVLVNGCLIAQGEVVVVNDKFGIRLTDIISPSERIRKLNR